MIFILILKNKISEAVRILSRWIGNMLKSMKVSIHWIIEFIVIYKYRSWFVQLLVITRSGFCFESFFVHKLARTLMVNIAAGQLLFYLFVNRCWLTKIDYLIFQTIENIHEKLSDTSIDFRKQFESYQYWNYYKNFIKNPYYNFQNEILGEEETKGKVRHAVSVITFGLCLASMVLLLIALGIFTFFR